MATKTAEGVSLTRERRRRCMLEEAGAGKCAGEVLMYAHQGVSFGVTFETRSECCATHRPSGAELVREP